MSVQLRFFLVTALLVALPQLASAQVVNLTDGQGKLWDIDAADFGEIINGTSDAYDSYPVLCVLAGADVTSTVTCPTANKYDAGGAAHTMSASGREVRTAERPVAGLTVSRRVYVPAMGTGFARYLDILRNDTAAPITFKIRVGTVSSTVNDLGDSTSNVLANSAGTTTIIDGLSWFVNGGTPQIVQVPGPVGVGTMIRNAFGNGNDSFYWEYQSITLAPGATAIYMHFQSQQDNTAMSTATAMALIGSPDLTNIAMAEVGLIRNWITTPQPDGSSCFVDSQCTSGNCVDSVCCDTTCNGGIGTDCQACSIAAGAAADGVCGVASPSTVCREAASLCDFAETCDGMTFVCPADVVDTPGTVCRPAAGSCDIDEVCDGINGTCPPDVLVVAGTECRANAGPCDVPEQCEGTSSACPFDDFATGAVECRASRGTCDPAEACNGLTGICPLDATLAPGAVCRPSASSCDAAEVCDGAAFDCPADVGAADGTACGDAMICNGDEVCLSGACMAPGPLDCDDGDVCTADMCSEADGCTNVEVADCCRMDMECDDGDPCTDDSCTTSGACANDVIPGCGMVADGGTEEDAGTPPEDAATGTDGSITPPPPPRDDGCDCSAPGEHDRTPLAALVLIGLVGAVLSRRRR